MLSPEDKAEVQAMIDTSVATAVAAAVAAAMATAVAVLRETIQAAIAAPRTPESAVEAWRARSARHRAEAEARQAKNKAAKARRRQRNREAWAQKRAEAEAARIARRDGQAPTLTLVKTAPAVVAESSRLQKLLGDIRAYFAQHGAEYDGRDQVRGAEIAQGLVAWGCTEIEPFRTAPGAPISRGGQIRLGRALNAYCQGSRLMTAGTDPHNSRCFHFGAGFAEEALEIQAAANGRGRTPTYAEEDTVSNGRALTSFVKKHSGRYDGPDLVRASEAAAAAERERTNALKRQNSNASYARPRPVIHDEPLEAKDPDPARTAPAADEVVLAPLPEAPVDPSRLAEYAEAIRRSWIAAARISDSPVLRQKSLALAKVFLQIEFPIECAAAYVPWAVAEIRRGENDPKEAHLKRNSSPSSGWICKGEDPGGGRMLIDFISACTVSDLSIDQQELLLRRDLHDRCRDVDPETFDDDFLDPGKVSSKPIGGRYDKEGPDQRWLNIWRNDRERLLGEYRFLIQHMRYTVDPEIAASMEHDSHKWVVPPDCFRGPRWEGREVPPYADYPLPVLQVLHDFQAKMLRRELVVIRPPVGFRAAA